MAKKNRDVEDTANVKIRSPKPIRPFITGVGVAAIWGSSHIPATLTLTALVGFGGRLAAVAIGMGGVIAVIVELLRVTPWMLRKMNRADRMS